MEELVVKGEEGNLVELGPKEEGKVEVERAVEESEVVEDRVMLKSMFIVQPQRGRARPKFCLIVSALLLPSGLDIMLV